MKEVFVSMDEYRPDLPELESVQTNDVELLPFLLMFGGLILGVTFSIGELFVKYGQYLETGQKVLVSLIPACVLFLVIRVLTGYCHYKTSADGLIMRGLFRSRFIPWTDIREASTVETRLIKAPLLLKTDCVSVKVQPRGWGVSSWNGDCLIASVWQHLRRMGLAERIKLNEVALRLWSPIPDSVPEELEWGSPASWLTRVGAVLSVMVFAVFIIVVWDVLGKSVSKMFMMLSVTTIYVVMLKETARVSMRRARVISVKRDGLQAEQLFGNTCIPWSDVTSAHWHYSRPRVYLVVESAVSKKSIYIPYTEGDSKSEELTFAVIRYLRKAVVPQAILLPQPISSDTESLKRTTNSDRASLAMKRAYINSLQEPVKTHIRRLYHLDFAVTILGFLFMLLLIAGDGLERVSRLIHSASDSRFLIIGNTGFPSICIVMGSFVLFAYAGEWIASRMAGAFSSEWKEFKKVGAPGKSILIIVRIFALMGVLGILTSPLFIDCYMRITDKGIVVNRLFEFRERFYRWDQVSGATADGKTCTSHGRPSQSWSYTIDFTDGSHWTFSEGETIKNRDLELRQAAGFVASKLGKQLDYRYDNQ